TLARSADRLIDGVKQVRRGAVIGLETVPDAEDAHGWPLEDGRNGQHPGREGIVSVPACTGRMHTRRSGSGVQGRPVPVASWRCRQSIPSTLPSFSLTFLGS